MEYVDEAGDTTTKTVDVPADVVTTLTNALTAGNKIGTYTNETGAAVDLYETVTSVSDFSIAGSTITLKYKDETGTENTKSFDLPAAVAETVTTLTNALSTGNKIGTYTNESAVVVDIYETVTALANVIATGHKIGDYTNESGVNVVLNETITSVSDLSIAGNIITLKYIDEAGTENEKTVTVPSDVVTTLTNALATGNKIGTYTNESGAVVDIYQTITSIGTILFDAVTGVLTIPYTDEAGVVNNKTVTLPTALNVLTNVQPTPTATGNTTNLNSTFKDANGDTWIVDSNGDAIKAGSSQIFPSVTFGTVTPPTGGTPNEGDEYFVTTDGTKDGEITEQWIYDATTSSWVLRPSSKSYKTTSLTPVYGTGSAYVNASNTALATVADQMKLSGGEIVDDVDVTWTGHGLTVHAWYYLDAATGGYTTVKPTTGYVQQLFFVKDANTIHIDIEQATDAQVGSSSSANVTYGTAAPTGTAVTGSEYFITTDGTSAGTITASYIFDGTSWVLRPAGNTPFKNLNEFHVDPNGNDTTGDGSQEKPFLTITKALTIADQGDQVVVHAGVYTENITISKPNVSLVGAEGDYASLTQIDGSVTITANGTSNRIADCTINSAIDSGTAGLYLNNVTIKSTIVSSGGYVEIKNSSIQDGTITKSGGSILIENSKVDNVNITGAGTAAVIRDTFQDPATTVNFGAGTIYGIFNLQSGEVVVDAAAIPLETAALGQGLTAEMAKEAETSDFMKLGMLRPDTEAAPTKYVTWDEVTGRLEVSPAPTTGGAGTIWVSESTDPTFTGNTGTLPRFQWNTTNDSKWYVDSNGIALLIEGVATPTGQNVYFNDVDPATGTIFDTANPPVTNNDALKEDSANTYYGTDGSVWTWNGTEYITKTYSYPTERYTHTFATANQLSFTLPSTPIGSTTLPNSRGIVHVTRNGIDISSSWGWVGAVGTYNVAANYGCTIDANDLLRFHWEAI